MSAIEALTSQVGFANEKPVENLKLQKQKQQTHIHKHTNTPTPTHTNNNERRFRHCKVYFVASKLLPVFAVAKTKVVPAKYAITAENTCALQM